MVSIRQWYGRRILGNIPLILAHFDNQKGVFRREPGKDHNYRHCLRPLAYFYRHPADGNPFHGDRAVLDMVLRAGDYTVSPEGHDPEDGGLLGTEWIPFNLVECIDWLGEELGAERKQRWTAAIAAHLDEMQLVSNYVASAPNHRIWQAALLARAGNLFDNDQWRRSGRWMARQICSRQTVDGYWDESRRGQGPSPNYHRTHLAGLDLYYRYSGDEEVREALHRGVDFAIRAAYPDGTPIDVFDSRQPYLAAFAVAMGANAICRAPAGRRLVRSQIARLDELGVTDGNSPVGFAVNWYLFATTDFLLDCYLYCDDGPDEPMEQEADGYTDVFLFTGANHGPGVGGGAVVRRADWTIAVSAAETDLPRATNHIYNTERQSGFSLFHRHAGLVVGGGNRMRNHIPLANAIVLTGWKGVDCVGGRFPDQLVRNHGLPIGPDGASTEPSDPVKACYYPVSRRIELADGGVRLCLEFLFASVRFYLEASDSRQVIIRYAFDSAHAGKILLQVPIPLFHPGLFELDGQPVRVGDLEAIEQRPVEQSISLTSRGRTVRYVPRAGGPVLFTWPMEPIKNWQFKGMNYVPDVQYQPLYTVGLLSTEFRKPAGEGTLLTVEVADR